jgi:hypothetical protein
MLMMQMKNKERGMEFFWNNGTRREEKGEEGILLLLGGLYTRHRGVVIEDFIRREKNIKVLNPIRISD